MISVILWDFVPQLLRLDQNGEQTNNTLLEPLTSSGIGYDRVVFVYIVGSSHWVGLIIKMFHFY